MKTTEATNNEIKGHSDTPEADAMYAFWIAHRGDGGSDIESPMDFARKKERELIAAQARIEKAIERLHHAGSFSATIQDTIEILHSDKP